MLAFFNEDESFGETLRFIEERIPLGIFSMALPSRKVRWSPGMFRLLGLDPATHQPSEEMFHALIHPADFGPRAEIELILRNAMPLHRDIRILNPKGQLRWVRVNAEFLLDDRGRPHRLIGSFLDISAEYEARQLIKASQRRFDAMATACTSVWWSAGPDGRIEWLEGWEGVTGQDPEHSRDWGWVAMLHPDDTERVVAERKRALEAGGVCEIEMRIRLRGGSYRWVRARSVPVHDDAGEITEWVGGCIDIHASKEWPAPSCATGGLSGAQIRGGRGIVNWSVKQLSEATGVPVSTIRRIEEFDGFVGSHASAVEKIHHALVRAGADFVTPPNGKPAVRPA
jgi:PAS domain S-box-containing protein